MLDKRKDAALKLLDEWLDVTGVIGKGGSWHRELQSIVKDAVEIGFYGRVLGNESSPEWEMPTCERCTQFKTCNQAEPGKSTDGCLGFNWLRPADLWKKSEQ